ncbi:MAG: amidohydrolase [Phycisphaeraceae bacterium]|nr:MAG: amidohydrolase [Phycisphaeraceae bacterium]
MTTLASTELNLLTAFRRDLHKHPELGYQEKRTSEAIQRELTAAGVEFRAGYAGGTGVLAHLPATTGLDRPAVALRADIDALPIPESTGKPWSSVHEGVMHACGHDGHTAILLGTVRALAATEHRPNPVTFLFQPAEEGGGGGLRMCEDGALSGDSAGGMGPKVGRIFGLHNWPGLPFGMIATRPGPLLAATDMFEVTVRGTQTHAAFPHMGRDPIPAACQIVSALQTIPSRDAPPTDPIVVSVTQIHAGSTHNVIPGEARLAGTVRTVTDETRAMATKRFREVVERTASALGCSAEVDWHVGYPVTRNDPAMAAHVLSIGAEAEGATGTLELACPFLGGEDFSYYGEFAPACFFVLGTCPPGETNPALLHQAHFDFNDEAIPVGVEMFRRLALAEL